MEKVYWLLTVKNNQLSVSFVKNEKEGKLLRKQRLVSQGILLHFLLVSDSSEILEDVGLRSKENKTEIPLLKSGLQKCVRRQQTDDAMAIAKRLIQISFPVFLRRWVIIVTEDSRITADIAIVCWLDLYFDHSNIDSKFPYKSVCNWMMSHVNYITKLDLVPENWCENWSKYEKSSNQRLWFGDKENKRKILDLLKNNDQYSSVVFGLALYDERTKYFLCSDGPMMKSTINGIIEAKNVLNITHDKTVLWDDVFFSFQNIPLAAVDFHINPYFCETAIIRLQAYDIILTEDEIKKILWVKRSGVNYRFTRDLLDEKSEKAWGYLKKIFDDLSVLYSSEIGSDKERN